MECLKSMLTSKSFLCNLGCFYYNPYSANTADVLIKEEEDPCIFQTLSQGHSAEVTGPKIYMTFLLSDLHVIVINVDLRFSVSYGLTVSHAWLHHHDHNPTFYEGPCLSSK